MADQDFIISIRTTADTAGIRQTEAELKRLGIQVESVKRASQAGAGAGVGINAGDIGRLIGQIGGLSLAGGIYAFVDGMKRASAEIAKISSELDKQGEQLLRNAQAYDQQARHAQDTADVLKVSDATLKDIETAQKKVNELTQQEVGIAAKISDFLQTQLLARQRAAQMGDYESARQENLKTAEAQLAATRQRAMDDLIKAEEASNQTHEEKVQILNNEIAAAERAKQSALDNTDPGGYAKAGNNLVRLNKLLEETNRLEAQRRSQESRESQANAAERDKDKDFVQEQVQRASPQARRILQNEQAAQFARDQGREREADLFQKSAEQFQRSATPEQKQEVQVLEKLIEQNGLLRELRDIWR